MPKYREFAFPVGFQAFHSAQHLAFNFQLNRYYTIGWFDAETLRQAASQITDHQSWKVTMRKLAEQAEAENRLRDASIFYRAAEFYTNPADPEKNLLYNKFRDLFYTAFRDEPLEQHEIPFKDGYLSAIRLKPERTQKGQIVWHGGLDSFMEEFYPIATYFANAGYGIIMFEGPGQGRPLHQFNLKMTTDWENPTRTVLDHFKLKDVTLIGMSLGALLGPRAAAYEPRISRLVLWGIVYDLMAQNKLSMRLMLRILLGLKAKSKLNRLFAQSLEKRKPSDPSRVHAEWFFNQALYTTGCESVYDYFREACENYTTRKFSHLIKQDVLMLVGEDDLRGKARAFYEKQRKALVNAKSVTGRVFTREEHASQHCQAGNLKLALDYILDWIGRKQTSS